jgi:hypothetical protein
MAADIYRKLQQQLDHYSMGFPETASGIEIKILQYLFTEQEAQMFSLLTPMLETVRAVSARTGQPEDALAILRDKPAIVVTDCICRKTAALVDHDCGKPLKACFMFGSMGQYYLDRGMGRQISLAEAEKILAVSI